MMRKTVNIDLGVKSIAMLLCMLCAAMCSDETVEQMLVDVGEFLEEQGCGSAHSEEHLTINEDEDEDMQNKQEEEQVQEDTESISGIEMWEVPAPSTSHGRAPKKRGRKRKAAGAVKTSKPSIKCRNWKKKVPKGLLQGVNAETLERVVLANKEALEDINEKHMMDLNNETGCQVGSLEWISEIRDIVEAICDDIKNSREEEGEKREKARERIELLENIVEAYSLEWKKKRKFLTEAVDQWIPQYAQAFKELLANKEFVTELIRSGAALKGLDWRPAEKFRTFHVTVYVSLIDILKKGLEDMAKGKAVEDLRRNPTISTRLEGVKKCGSYEEDGSGEEKGLGSFVGSIKHTIFSVPFSLCFNDRASRSKLARRRGGREANKEASSSFSYPENLVRIRMQFRNLQSKITELLDSLDAHEKKGEEEMAELRRQVVQLRRRIVGGRKKMGLILDIHKYIFDHLGEYRRAGGHKRGIYTEIFESYMKKEIEKEDGDLESVVRILYAVMEESGHGRSVRAWGKEGALYVGGVDFDCSIRYKLAPAWIQAVSQQLAQMQRDFVSLNASYFCIAEREKTPDVVWLVE